MIKTNKICDLNLVSEEDKLQDRMEQTVDTNNNDAAVIKYSLRPRTTGKKTQEAVDVAGSRRTSTRKGSQTLSKYRRRSANARERSRMREINEAFEALRRVVTGASHADHQAEKMTKISTLRLAMRYITALSEALGREPAGSELAVESFATTSLNDTETPVNTALSSVCGQFVSGPSSSSFRTLPSNTGDTPIQHCFSEQYITHNTSETNSSFQFTHTTFDDSTDILQPADVQRYAFNFRTKATTAYEYSGSTPSSDIARGITDYEMKHFC